MSDVVLGVDIGTTATKVVAFDAEGREHGSAAAEYPLCEPHHGEAVQDPDAIQAGVERAVRESAAAAREAGAHVAGISFSAAMHTLIALDGEDRPLTPSITWGDTRAAAQAERLRREDEDHALHRRTGTPLHPMSPLAKLVWFREEAPDVARAARRWAGIKELVVARLTGEWAVDVSIASSTGLLELARLEWDAEALSLAGVEPAQLSPLAETTRALALSGEAAGRLELETGCPVVLGASDGTLANLGVGAVHPGVAACSIGTSGALRVMVERPAVDPQGSVFCYALVPDRWVVGGAINNGGVVLQWALDALAPELESEEALLDVAAQAPPGSGGLLMLPYLLGERAPHWNSLSRGSYVGLERGHGREHLVRAALEGVCLQLALVLDSMRAAGNEVREIRATGGFARSPLWRQMLADALGMDVGFAAAPEASAFGAALLGMQALGVIESVDVAAELVRIEEVVRPDPAAAEVYAERLELFDSLYDALAPAFAKLRALDS